MNSALVLGILANMARSLITEKVCKKLVIILAEWAAHKTKTPKDDELVAVIKEAWEGPSASQQQ